MNAHLLPKILLLAYLSSVVVGITPHRFNSFKSASREAKYASVIYNSQTSTYSLKSGVDKTAVAYGSFDDGLNTTGWGVLNVKTNSQYSDLQQFYAAGYLEGALTASDILDNYYNMHDYFFGNDGEPSQAVLTFFVEQDAWTRNKTSGDYEQLSDYWKQVALIMAQFDGLFNGYNDNRGNLIELGVFPFQMLNGVGDLLDLIPALDPSKRPDYDNMTPEEIRRTVYERGHCSALVKLTGDYNDLFTGHSSWFTYSAMNRIYKHYNFEGVSASFIKAKSLSFSSYPGFLESLDDFYIMSNQVVLLQTTNSILDHSIYDKVTHNALFAWQRVRLANHMADNGKEWAHLFGQWNSGTYNNQYMVVDYKLFTPGQLLVPNTLWVIEQIPGLVEAADVTNNLERGYWPSYNVAYFPKIYNMSGYPAFVVKNGLQYSYQLAPRAQLFRRDAGTAVDYESYKALLRSNDYLHDPYSKGDPWSAICSRGDLAGSAGGCIDTKATSYQRVAKMQSEAINGPTTSNNLPPFSWTGKFSSAPHFGMPTTYNFDFVQMQPEF